MLNMWSLNIILSHPKIPYDTQLKLQGARNILKIPQIEPNDEEAPKNIEMDPKGFPTQPEAAPGGHLGSILEPIQ